MMTTRAPSRASRLWKPEELLYELAMEKPREIDLEAIARFCGARVRYAELSGCAAKLVGLNDKAIITVDRSSAPARRRFSIGHELGHWMYDRGSAAFECTSRSFFDDWTSNNPETRANRFASELLLPEKMFKAAAAEMSPDFDAIRILARRFQTSLSATAIRYVKLSSDRPFLLCACRKGRRSWFVRSPGISPRLFPLEWPASPSLSRVVRGMGPGEGQKVAGNLWLDVPHARESVLLEETIVIERNTRESLTLLSWPNARTGCMDCEMDEEGYWWGDSDD